MSEESEKAGDSPLCGPIITALRRVYDPEIPVNIYDMGLVYDIEVDGAGKALITMTLTSPHCPAAEMIPLDIKSKVKAVDGISDCEVKVVWEPPWDREMMSEAAKLELGLE
ncbi:MAG: iron-sulfur cluster assembly protein [Planctomycetota bacterium]